MKCSEVQEILPDILDGASDAELDSHLQSCPACSELAAELKLIASEARGLAASDEPPARLWVQISNQLRAEGIIRLPEAAPGRPVLVPAPARRWNAWWLAPVAAAILAAGAYQLTHQNAAPTAPLVAQQQTVAPAPTQPQTGPQVSQSAASAPAANQTAAPLAAKTPSANQPVKRAQHRTLPSTRATGENATVASNARAESDISAPPNDEDQRFLSEVSVNAPAMRAAYEKQLRAVNTEIRETLAYIKLHPEDQDARQHLMEVYQAKAMLYQLALDRVQ